MKGKGEEGGGAERYLGGGQAEARGRNGLWIRSGAGCLKERAGGCVVAARSLSRLVLLDNGNEWREKAKGQKTLGPELERHKKEGAFLGAQQAAGDEKTGARGRRVRAREAH